MVDQQIGRERSVLLHFGLRVGQRLDKEQEEAAGEPGDGTLYAVDDLGERSDRGRAVGGRTRRVVVLDHVGQEAREERRKVGTEGGREGTDEVGRRTDERSVVLGLVGACLLIPLVVLFLIVVELARRLPLQDLGDLFADRPNVLGHDQRRTDAHERGRERVA